MSFTTANEGFVTNPRAAARMTSAQMSKMEVRSSRSSLLWIRKRDAFREGQGASLISIIGFCLSRDSDSTFLFVIEPRRTSFTYDR